MKSKTPYELRFDLLAMAQSIITENLMNDRIRLENDWNMKKDLDVAAAERGVSISGHHYFPEIPKINPDDVVALARKLNEFVSDNGEYKND